MKLPPSLTTVTPLSRILALFLFILFPIVGFYLGMNYQASIVEPAPILTSLVRKPTPTPKKEVLDTSNWKTYTNYKYNYSLKYSEDINLKQFSCSNIALEKGDITFVLDETNSTFPECGFGGYAWPISITPGQALDCESSDGWNAVQSQIVVTGRNSIRCTKTFAGKRETIGPDIIDQVIVGKDDGFSFYITLTNIKYKNTFDQILSTFKFTQ